MVKRKVCGSYGLRFSNKMMSQIEKYKEYSVHYHSYYQLSLYLFFSKKFELSGAVLLLSVVKHLKPGLAHLHA